MILLGLTGSIGMGKSTTAKMFAEAGIPIWDADAAVHRLYSAGGKGVQAIQSVAPGSIVNGAVDRGVLRDLIGNDPALLQRIEGVVHPLVADDRSVFIEAERAKGASLVLLDIPLLFETGADEWLDRIVVVTATAEEQRRRVLARPGMTEARLEAILAKQLPDAEKRARADFVIDTMQGIDGARAQVAAILEDLGETSHA